MPNTLTFINSFTADGNTSTFSFGSIPQTYTDLVMLLSLRSTSGSTYSSVTPLINGSLPSFTQRWIFANNGTTPAGSTSASYWGDIHGVSSAASSFGNQKIYIPNYAAAINKAMYFEAVGSNDTSNAFPELGTITWNSTAAITSIGGTSTAGNFAQYSTAYLYGVINTA